MSELTMSIVLLILMSSSLKNWAAQFGLKCLQLYFLGALCFSSFTVSSHISSFLLYFSFCMKNMVKKNFNFFVSIIEIFLSHILIFYNIVHESDFKDSQLFFACCIYLFYIIYYCYVIIRLYYQLLFLDFSEKIKEKSRYCKKEMVSFFQPFMRGTCFFVFSVKSFFGQ